MRRVRRIIDGGGVGSSIAGGDRTRYHTLSTESKLRLSFMRDSYHVFTTLDKVLQIVYEASIGDTTQQMLFKRKLQLPIVIVTEHQLETWNQSEKIRKAKEKSIYDTINSINKNRIKLCGRIIVSLNKVLQH